jgi:predicted RNase H-like HicB family nuclease
MTNMADRTIIIKWNESDNCFVADCPEKPGLNAFGQTELEALDEFLQAEELWDEGE